MDLERCCRIKTKHFRNMFSNVNSFEKSARLEASECCGEALSKLATLGVFWCRLHFSSNELPAIGISSGRFQTHEMPACQTPVSAYVSSIPQPSEAFFATTLVHQSQCFARRLPLCPVYCQRKVKFKRWPAEVEHPALCHLPCAGGHVLFFFGGGGGSRAFQGMNHQRTRQHAISAMRAASQASRPANLPASV